MSKPQRDLTPDEAEQISQHAREGRLDVDDPEIDRIVTQAQRTLVRHSLWGDVSPSRRRWVFIGGIAFVLLWVIGLAVPLLLTFGQSR